MSLCLSVWSFPRSRVNCMNLLSLHLLAVVMCKVGTSAFSPPPPHTHTHPLPALCSLSLPLPVSLSSSLTQLKQTNSSVMRPEYGTVGINGLILNKVHGDEKVSRLSCLRAERALATCSLPRRRSAEHHLTAIGHNDRISGRTFA